MPDFPHYVRPKDFFPNDVHEELNVSAHCYRQVNNYKICIQRHSPNTYYVDIIDHISFWKKFIAYPEWLIRRGVFSLRNWKGQNTNYMHLDPIEFIVVFSRGEHLLAQVVFNAYLVFLIVLTLMVLKSCG